MKTIVLILICFLSKNIYSQSVEFINPGGGQEGLAHYPEDCNLILDVKNKKRARQGLEPLPGGTNSGNTNKGVPTKDTKFATDKLLNTNRTDGKTYSAADAKRMEKSFNQRLQSEPDFDEFDNVPVVNSKGKKVKKIPGTNAMPSGGSNKSVNANLDSF